MNNTMESQTSQAPEQRATPHTLEEKLKIHIQREFDLGEKVISLLKQRNVLETHLQEQLTSREELEHKLEKAVVSKQTLEQKFSQMQKELRAQQKALRQRSRRFVQTAEDSREDLKALREEIRRLKDQLEILDIQKVEEHVRLSNKIKELGEQERQLKQELQIITYQKELAEEELDGTAENFQKLAESHERETRQHEQEIERLQRKHAQLEIQTAHLLDEQQRNERKLQQEIDTLRRSKAELENKVKHSKQQQPDPAQAEIEADLLQLIEEKEQAIQFLQQKAHQRSAMLRAENDSLKQEVKNMVSAQEKISWENQRLESSLKSLQQDFAEYLVLKNKFEEVQREKDDFERIFYQKIQALEERYLDAQQSQQDPFVPAGTKKTPQQEEPTERIEMSAPEKKLRHKESTERIKTSPPEKKPKTTEKKAEPLSHKKPKAPTKHVTSPAPKTHRQSGNNFWFTLLVPVGILLLILVGVIIYMQVSFRSGLEDLSGDTAELPPIEFTLPEDKFDMIFPLDTDMATGITEPLLSREPLKQEPAPEENDTPQRQEPQSFASPPAENHVAEIPTTTPPATEKPSQSASPETPKANHVAEIPTPTPQATQKPSQSASTATPKKQAQPQRSVAIVVQLPGTSNPRFLPKEQQPFPTVENNVVLRRHYERKH